MRGADGGSIIHVFNKILNFYDIALFHYLSVFAFTAILYQIADEPWGFSMWNRCFCIILFLSEIALILSHKRLLAYSRGLNRCGASIGLFTACLYLMAFGFFQEHNTKKIEFFWLLMTSVLGSINCYFNILMINIYEKRLEQEGVEVEIVRRLVE